MSEDNSSYGIVTTIETPPGSPTHDNHIRQAEMETLRELTTTDLTHQPLGLTFNAESGRNIVLKLGVIHTLLSGPEQ